VDVHFKRFAKTPRTRSYAEVNGYFKDNPRPHGWLDRIGLAEAHGRTLVRAHLTPEQTRAFVDALPEPYATLVLLLGTVGLRGEAAVGLQPADLDAEDALYTRRVIYNRGVFADKEERFPLDAVIHAELLHRLRTLGTGAKWVFHSRTGTPLDLGNARKRHLHVVATALGIKVGGWHDFRHALVHTLRVHGVHSKVVSKMVGHASEAFTERVYDHAEQKEIGNALAVMGKRLAPSVAPNARLQ
jgi:integrase